MGRSEKEITVLAVDPGKTGAYALVRSDNTSVHTFKDFLSATRHLTQEVITVACIEDQVAFGMGRTSAFRYGMHYGTWVFILETLVGHPANLHYIRPTMWQSVYNYPKLPKTMNKNERVIKLKNHALEVASKLYPKFKDLSDGEADALLLGTYVYNTIKDKHGK